MANIEDIRLQKIVTAISSVLREDILLIQGSLTEPAKMWEDEEQIREARDGALKARTSARTLCRCIREFSIANERMHDVTYALALLEANLKEIFISFDNLLYAERPPDLIRRSLAKRVRSESTPVARHVPDQGTLRQTARRVQECLDHLRELDQAATELSPSEAASERTLDEIAKHNDSARPGEMWVTRENMKTILGCSTDKVKRVLKELNAKKVGPKGTVVYNWEDVQELYRRKFPTKVALPSNPVVALRAIAAHERQVLDGDK